MKLKGSGATRFTGSPKLLLAGNMSVSPAALPQGSRSCASATFWAAAESENSVSVRKARRREAVAVVFISSAGEKWRY